MNEVFIWTTIISVSYTHLEIDGKELILALRKKGIIVRHWNKERIDQYLRISIGTMEQMKIMLEFLSEYIEKRS